MKNQKKQQIKKAVIDKMSVKKMSQNICARQIGISPALLSNVINEKWDLISDAVWHQIYNYCDMNNTWRIRETRNLRVITDLCRDAQKNSRMLAIAGYSGAGKTTALKYYATHNQNVFYILSTVVMSRKDFLRAIQRSIGFDNEGPLHYRIDSIIEKLVTMENPLLIIDDAGKLNDSCQRLIQIFYDAMENKLGIILSGTSQLRNYLFKMAAKNKMGYRELKRRIGYWQKMFPPSLGFIKAICNDYNIDDSNAANFIKREAHNYGAIKELITNASRTGDNINVELLASLNVGDKDWEK